MSRQAFSELLLRLLLLAPGPRKPVGNLLFPLHPLKQIPILNAAQFDELLHIAFPWPSCV